MRNNYWRLSLLAFAISILSIGCGKPDQSHESLVRIQFPVTESRLSQSVTTFNAAGGWSASDPNTLDDIVCFALAVEGPETSLSTHTCSDVNDNPVFHPFLIAGTVASGGGIEIEVPAGQDRTFYAIGFGATSLDACLAFTLIGFPERSKLSAPHIIGQKTVDLVPGEIDLEIIVSLDGAKKFNECSGDFLNPDPALVQFVGTGTYDYGDRTTGSTISATFILDNIGGSTTTQLSEIGLAPPYAFTGGVFPGTGGTCTDKLRSDKTCLLSVAYSPTVAGNPVTDNIEIKYFDAFEFQTTQRALTAIASVPATLVYTEAPLFDFGNTTVVTLTSERTFTVTNTGDYDATAVTGSGLAAPYSFKGGSYPGTGGTCGAIIVKATACTLLVEFNPSLIGLTSDSLDLNFHDGTDPQVSSCSIQGTGAPPANIAISDAALYDFGTVARGSSNDFLLTVSNTGGAPATSLTGSGLAAPFTYKGGSYPGTGGSCGVTLANGSSCSIEVNYLPSANGFLTDDIDLAYFDALANQNSLRTLQGTAVDPALLNISNVGYNFGTVANGASVDFMFSVSNAGAITATSIGESNLSAPYTIKGGTWPGTGGDCGTSLAPAGSCNFVISYAPTGQALDNDTIQVDYNNGATSVNSTNNISGTGAFPASLAISDGATYDYGTLTVGLTLDKTFTVSNTGGVPATSLSESGLAGDFDFVGATYPGGGNCSTSLSAGSNCTIIVRYTPSAGAADAGNIQINYTNGVGPTNTTRALAGFGRTPAAITISDSDPYDYGLMASGSTTSYLFTLTNTGTDMATSLGATFVTTGQDFNFNGGSYPGTGGNCSTSLAGGANCTIDVLYSTSILGTANDTLRVDYNDGVTAQNSQRTIAGTGATPANLSISDGATFDYGNVTVGLNSDKSFTVSNSGGVTATVMSGSGLAGDFTFAGGSYPGGGTCGASLAAAGSCTVIVRYTPATAAPDAGTLQINYTNGVSATNTTRALAGTGLDPALIALSESNPYDYGLRATGSATSHIFTLTNSGDVSATAIAASLVTTGQDFTLNGAFPGAGGNCGITLAPSGASCTIDIIYSTSIIGAAIDTIRVDYNDGVSAQNTQRTVTGTGALPASLAISDGATFDFGNITVGLTSDKTFTISNTGGVTATSMSGSGLSGDLVFVGGSYPGGGTCVTSLAAAANCTVIVRYTPATAAVDAGTLQVNYTNGVTATNSTRALSGTGLAPAGISLSESNPYNYGTKATGSTTLRLFTLTNNGDVSATGIAVSFLTTGQDFTLNGAFPGAGGSCATTLASGGATCTIQVLYSTSIIGAVNDTIKVDYNDGVTAQNSQRTITATGAAPASLAISDPATYNYGNVTVGLNADKTFTISNSGGVSTTGMGGSGLGGDFAFAGGSYPGGGTCGTSLAAAGNCTVIVRYTPATAAADADTLQINYTNGVATTNTTRALSGTGLAPASLAISESNPYNYGLKATGSTTSYLFTLTNNGDVSATGIAVSFVTTGQDFTLNGAFPGAGGNCATTLASGGATCTIDVLYSTSISGAANDTIKVDYNDGVALQNSQRTITGTGTSPASLAISDPATYNYGNVTVGLSADKTFTISNSGGVTATVMSGSGLAGDFAFVGGSYPGGGTCGTTLVTAGNCTVVVRYTPATAAADAGTLQINYTDGVSATNTTRALSGTGLTPATLAISESNPYNFGTKATGSTTLRLFTLTNNGDVSATGIAVSFVTTGQDFTLNGAFPGTGGNCTTTLASGGTTCTIQVLYSSSILGAVNDTIKVDYNDGVTAQNSQRTITATGATPASLTISDPATYNYGNITVGLNADKTFTISNSGGVSTTGMSGSGLAGDFAFVGGSYPGGGTCGTSLAAAGNCTVIVRYTPTTAAADTGTLQINYTNGVATTNTTRALSGTGLAPAQIVFLDANPYDYGNQATASTTTYVLTIQNTGGVTATSISGVGLAAPFDFEGGSFPGSTGNCGTSLTATSTCTISVDFTPPSAIFYPDTLVINYNDGVSAQVTNEGIQGTGL